MWRGPSEGRSGGQLPPRATPPEKAEAPPKAEAPSEVGAWIDEASHTTAATIGLSQAGSAEAELSQDRGVTPKACERTTFTQPPGEVDASGKAWLGVGQISQKYHHG